MAHGNPPNLRVSTRLPLLDEAINATNIAMDGMRRTPARAAIAVVNNILTVVRVGFLPLYVGRLPNNAYGTPWPTNRSTSTSGWSALESQSLKFGLAHGHEMSTQLALA